MNAPTTAYTGAMAWRSVAPIRPRGLTNLQFHLGEGCFFRLCPVGDGRTYGFGNITESRAEEPMAGRLDRLRRRFSGFGGIVQDYLAALSCDEQIHYGPVDWVALEQWHRGRVVLIGDAPAPGWSGCADPPDHVARRRPRVSWVHQESDAVTRSFRLPAAARNAALPQYGEEMFQRRSRRLLRHRSRH